MGDQFYPLQKNAFECVNRELEVRLDVFDEIGTADVSDLAVDVKAWIANVAEVSVPRV
jgi:hypothetical protein